MGEVRQELSQVAQSFGRIISRRELLWGKPGPNFGYVALMVFTSLRTRVGWIRP